mmetsp:Transcript_1556/g.3151  ORF Transcript_1556/g.3151 Transcript_1556/m.3151 type:complete len:206 (-) Transcript_1556:278-895(-)
MNVVEVTFKLGRIISSKRQFSWSIVSQVERKDGLIQLVLLEGILKDSCSPIDTDGGETQSKDSIKFAKGVGNSKTTSILDLTEPLSFNDNVIRDSDRILGEVTRHASTSVHDFEIGSILQVCRTSLVIILGLLSNEWKSTVFAANLGDPKIGRSSVKNDLEGLGRSSNGNGSIVLGVGIVLDGLGFSLLQGGRFSSQLTTLGGPF